MNQKVIPFFIGFIVASCSRGFFHIFYWLAIGAAFGLGHYLK